MNPSFGSTEIQAFLDRHHLPASYAAQIEDFFLPLATRLVERRPEAKPLVVGINGAQGTGKSTLADLLVMAVGNLFEWNAVALSIDDFYLTRAERETLADTRHPLLRTRGVPGTHDIDLLEQTLDRLANLENGQSARPPRFDKSVDDRAQPPWPPIRGPVDMIVLEGWCVGTPAENDAALIAPVNELERRCDRDGRWRRWANHQLQTTYASVWSRLDVLVYLRAPDFDAVYRWRLEQETKLAAAAGTGARGVMTADEVREFISYYERLTRQAIRTLPAVADVVFELGEDHRVRAAGYR